MEDSFPHKQACTHMAFRPMASRAPRMQCLLRFVCLVYTHCVCVLMHALACNQRGQRLMSDVLVYNLLFWRQGFSLNLGARQVGSKPQQFCCLHPPQLSPCLLETQIQVCVLVQLLPTEPSPKYMFLFFKANNPTPEGIHQSSWK